jgi:hypothetical protein
MLIAAHCTLGDLGPVVTELLYEHGRYRIESDEFRTDDEALAYWSSLKADGHLIWDEGRLYVGRELAALDVSMDPRNTLVTFIFDEANDDASLSCVFCSKFAAEALPGFMGNVTMKPQETLEQGENIGVAV